MKVDLNGQVALITGAAAGIGQAMAIAMAENGATIVGVDLAGRGEETIETITRSGGVCEFFSADICKADLVEDVVNTALARYDKIDILVNNAGTNSPAELRKNIYEYAIPEWHRIVEIDLDGLFYFCRTVTPSMVARRNGVIINVASVLGVIPIRLQSAFTAAKAGVINFSRSMALELGPKGIRVNVIAPGSVLTQRTRDLFYNPSRSEISQSLVSHIPLGRPGNAEEVAKAALFLASSDSSYITGTVLTVDGGWTAGFAREW